MLGIAWAFSYLDRLAASAGAAYAWVGRVMHPARQPVLQAAADPRLCAAGGRGLISASLDVVKRAQQTTTPESVPAR